MFHILRSDQTTFCLLMNTKTLADISAMVLCKGLFDNVLPAGAAGGHVERFFDSAVDGLEQGPDSLFEIGRATFVSFWQTRLN